MRLDSLVNRGDYFSAHYLAEVLPKDLKKKDGLLSRWTERERQHRLDQEQDAQETAAEDQGAQRKPAWVTPRQGLRALGKPYFAERPYFAEFDTRRRDGDTFTPAETAEHQKKLHELHGDVLRALGFDAQPRELTAERAGREHIVTVAYADDHLIAVECGWAVDVDAALDDDQAGLLLEPVPLDNREEITSGSKLARWLFAGDTPPRYVLILAGGVVILADRATWGEGRFLGVSLDIALGRNDIDELSVIAALFGADSLLPPEEGGAEPLADLLGNSRNHAVGVSKDLRDGLKESVELIANEILDRIRAQGARPEDVMEPTAFAKELGREALRYLYRILFLLYAEARPELGILPTDDPDYGKGYSLARLGDLVVRDLTGEEARDSLHLYESLDLLFRLVNGGHRRRTGDEVSDGEGLRFEPMRSDLFEPRAIRLIRKDLPVDDDEGRTVDTRLHNGCLYQVLRKLMLAKGRRRERGGFISYAQLGINQLGAVYEGLMSYTGFIATEDLLEVAKDGNPKDGSWMIPASKENDYPSDVFVKRTEEDGTKTEEYKRYAQGSFVYRLAGRERETSASYYTPESLTKVTVQLALKYRLDQDGTTTSAEEILGWKICEPALGSGAFLNEAINQVAAEYLKRRQRELGQDIDPERHEEELQKTKAYIALHNSYGVDLNETAVELAEVSLWLNVMHPGLQAPWFGLHLRRGNSLIGAGRKVYDMTQLTKGEWLTQAPDDLPFSAGAVPAGKIHHFLVPADGWGAVAGAKEAKALAPEEAAQLAAWRKGIKKRVAGPSKNGTPSKQMQRLQGLARRVEFLWDLVIQRLAISEREISRKIDVWGADWITQPENAVPKEKVYQDLTAVGSPHWRLKQVMDAWCALWFWPLDKAGLLDGSDVRYEQELNASSLVESIVPMPTEPAKSGEPRGFKQVFVTESLFSLDGEQMELTEFVDSKVEFPKKTQKARIRKFSPIRNVIPLKNLDDWLDFAEAVLGRDDAPEDSLISSFTDLDSLAAYEDQLPIDMAMDSEFKLAERFPWLGAVKSVSDQYGFFHWEVHFAYTFIKGGFDLQIGNPPWFRPRWEEGPIFAEMDPWFVMAEMPDPVELVDRKNALLKSEAAFSYVGRELALMAGSVEYLGGGVAYPLLAGTQPDLYRAFMCRIWDNLGMSGTAGLIHPDSHCGGVKEGALRAEAFHHLRVHAKFINAANWAFEDLSRTQEFGLHVYGKSRNIDFIHFSDLYGADVILQSLEHNGAGPLPGIKYQGKWDIRPHSGRIIRVNEEALSEWKRLLGGGSQRTDETPLLYPITTAEAGAIEALSHYKLRLSELDPRISRGFDESSAKRAGFIRWNPGPRSSLSEVIMQGPHILGATPYAKQPPNFKSSDQPQDLTKLGSDAVHSSNYERSCNSDDYRAVLDLWDDSVGIARPYTEYYRLAWREMIPSNGERSLFAAILPPGPAHIHAVRSMAAGSNSETVMVAGFWAALPLDYLLRITGKGHLDVTDAHTMPAPGHHHPLAQALILRILRMNCLTAAYSELWQELYCPEWQEELWAMDWPVLRPVGDITPTWNRDTPLRSEYSRRAALVEMDALVSLWLGMTAEQLIAIYRARYPVLSDYEARVWFDAAGRKVAGNHNAFGHGQTKDNFQQLMDHLDPEICGPVPAGYTAPFYKADREAEYRQAHAHFADRLCAAGYPVPRESSSEEISA
ncbi:restriction endonuclease subunit M [Nocardia zapadnayensis]|uniref:restriction endonuclease subunit M n=1 Tax=Nocardia rhamnosiphila TaxID=426716 RepID=UPI002247C754|nr:restriction endonuclease subunit M [Nocardia zapadnayensis]MCX0274239.1 restriction endonuclease subunit M [Nocardia zapadnayensis]